MIKNEAIKELYKQWLIPEGTVDRVISTEIEKYEKRISELNRQNELLRIVAKAAEKHLIAIENGFRMGTNHPLDTIELRNELRSSLYAAIDSNALGENE